MNLLDIIILVLLIPGVVSGLFKGFINQAMAIIGLIAGIFLAGRFTSLVALPLSGLMPGVDPTAINIFAFIIIFVCVMVILAFLGKLLEKIFSFALLGWVNTLLGGVFGLVRGIVVIALLVSLFEAFNGTFEMVSGEYLDGCPVFQSMSSISETIMPYLRELINPAKELLQGSAAL